MNQETLKKYDLGKGLVVEVGNRPKAARSKKKNIFTEFFCLQISIFNNSTGNISSYFE